MPETVTLRDAAASIRVPVESDDKYSRGVLGIVAGSERYPGAAVLAVEAALRTGVGMVRYLGPARPAASRIRRPVRLRQRRPRSSSARTASPTCARRTASTCRPRR